MQAGLKVSRNHGANTTLLASMTSGAVGLAWRPWGGPLAGSSRLTSKGCFRRDTTMVPHRSDGQPDGAQEHVDARANRGARQRLFPTAYGWFAVSLTHAAHSGPPRLYSEGLCKAFLAPNGAGQPGCRPLAIRSCLSHSRASLLHGSDDDIGAYLGGRPRIFYCRLPGRVMSRDPVD